jgi:hypothetical protein
MVQEGATLRDLERLLGHASLESTAVYLEGIAPIETIAVVRDRKPPFRRRRMSPNRAPWAAAAVGIGIGHPLLALCDELRSRS